MSDELVFALRLDTKPGEADLAAAVGRMEKAFKPLEKKGADLFSPKKSGGKHFEEMQRDFTSAMSAIDRASADAARKYGDRWQKVFEKMRTELQKALEQRTQTGGASGMFGFREDAQQSQNQLKKTIGMIDDRMAKLREEEAYLQKKAQHEIDLNRRVQESYERINSRVTGSNKTNSASISPAAQFDNDRLANKQKVIEKEKKLEDSLNEHNERLTKERHKKRQELFKEQERADNANAREQVRKEQMLADAFQRIDNKKTQAVFLGAEQREKIHTDAALGLMNLEKDMTTMTVQEVRRRVSAIQAVMNASISQQAIAGRTGGFGGANSVMFQFQQIVEDSSIGYQLNGWQGALRGSVNNMALLASMMSGPTGVAALAGLMAVNAGMLVSHLWSAGEPTEKMADGLEKSLNRMEAIRHALRDMESISLSQASKGEGLGVLLGSRRKLEELEKESKLISGQIGMIDSLIRKEKELAEAKVTQANASQAAADSFRQFGTVEELDKATQNVRRLEKELAQLQATVNKALGADVTPDVREGNKTQLEEKVKELEIQKQIQRNTIDYQQSLRKVHGENFNLIKKSAEMEEKIMGTMHDQEFTVRSISEWYKKLQESQQDRMGGSNMLKIAEAEDAVIRARAKLAEAGPDPVERMKAEQEYAQALKDRSVILASITAQMEAELKPAAELGHLLEQTHMMAVEHLSILKQQALEVERRIEKEAELQKTLEAQGRAIDKQASKQGLSHGLDVLGAKGSLAQFDAGQAKERIQAQAQAARDNVQRQFDAIGGFGAEQFFQGKKDMIDAQINAKEQAMLKAIDSKLKTTEALLSKQKTGLLSDAADKATREAQNAVTNKLDPQHAKQNIEAALEALRELKSQQLSGAASGDKGAIGAADATEKKIQSMFDLLRQLNAEELKASQMRQKEEQTRLQQVIKDYMETLKLAEATGNTALISGTSIERAQQMLALMQGIAAAAKITEAVFNPGGAASQLPEFGGAKASGGPVSGGRSYLVGEQGPEMFVPSMGGSIIPAGVVAALMHAGTTVNNRTNIGSVSVQSSTAQNSRSLMRDLAYAAKSASRRKF